MENAQLQSLATQTRRDILRMVHAVNSVIPEGLWDVLISSFYCTTKFFNLRTFFRWMGLTRMFSFCPMGILALFGTAHLLAEDSFLLMS